MPTLDDVMDVKYPSSGDVDLYPFDNKSGSEKPTTILSILSEDEHPAIIEIKKLLDENKALKDENDELKRRVGELETGIKDFNRDFDEENPDRSVNELYELVRYSV